MTQMAISLKSDSDEQNKLPEETADIQLECRSGEEYKCNNLSEIIQVKKYLANSDLISLSGTC